MERCGERAQLKADASAPRESLAWLGWFRVVSIAGVVLIHVNGLTAVAHHGDGSDVGRLALLLDFVSRWSVPAFVMASGAMLLDPGRFSGTGAFLRRRALRLVPALVVWHVVYAGVVVRLTGRFAPSELLQAALVGKLYTALYFFWIVLGLALLTPLLVPWVASVGTREVGAAGVVLAAMPAAAMAIVPVAPESEAWVRTAVTWWVPYLGYYLLGYAVRRARLRAWVGVASIVGFAGGSAWVVWQWRQPAGVGAVLEHYQPAESYFHPAVAVAACSAMYLSRWIIRPGAAGALFARPRMARLGRAFGAATLGVFAVHQLVLYVVERMPWLGGGAVASTPEQLVARCVVVFVGAYAAALIGGRIPGVRRVV
ncbi:acyltransferase [Mobilicoccus massiliensis]|uniref:acyltransferase n=1 Tax=Mobilicoccus massiliensis TaxID=1522310 RepID=UPI000591011D|nr:acyltransferase [Mobilicoccus massiliensis]